ncbi:hypothetical protein RDV64_04615 [Acuticoccus sp. MNP-M23]|uniref:PilZ domain-containing protein n=1 Tax=Acuticoccus sp. MNP-M23 TaxID=3072793 RepID=UPI002816023E|nr:PilZ domain-containing protein [Acuticoccus sp. MNP-M23]WMS43688.1 hypothetical protein RDV64_04615 [Acuticoccus sp. MNP-M23]
MSEEPGQTGNAKLRERIRDRRAGRARAPWGQVETAASAGAAPDTAYDHGYGGWTATVGGIGDAPRTVTPAADAAPETTGPQAGDPTPAENAPKARLGERLKKRLRQRNPQTERTETQESAADTVAATNPEPAQPSPTATDDAPELVAARDRLRRRNASAEAAAAGKAAGEPAPEPTPEPAPEPAAAPAAAAKPDEPAASAERALVLPPRRSGAGPRADRNRPRGDDTDGAKAASHNRRSQRIDGGGTVMIDEALYPLLDWSMGGIAVPPGRQDIHAGDRRTLEVEIDMRDYSVSLQMEGEAVNVTEDRIGWRFVSPNDRQRQVLRSLTNAACQGRSFAPPLDNTPAPKMIDTSGRDAVPRRSVGRFSPIAAVMSLPFNAAVIALVAGLAIIALPDGSSTESTQSVGSMAASTVRAEHAAVAVARQTLAADATGLVLEWGFAPGETVDEGDALVSLLLSAAGEETRSVIQSPCDCNLARILVDAGDRVVEGDPIALLYPRDAEGHVQAMFPFGTAPNLGALVSVALPYSGDRFEGVVEKVGRLDDPQDYIGLPASIVSGDRNSVYAHITTTPAVPAALAGDPAIVTVGAMETAPPEV